MQSVHVSELHRLEESCPRHRTSHPCWDERQTTATHAGGRPLLGATQPECDLYGQYAAKQCKVKRETEGEMMRRMTSTDSAPSNSMHS